MQLAPVSGRSLQDGERLRDTARVVDVKPSQVRSYFVMEFGRFGTCIYGGLAVVHDCCGPEAWFPYDPTSCRKSHSVAVRSPLCASILELDRVTRTAVPKLPNPKKPCGLRRGNPKNPKHQPTSLSTVPLQGRLRPS